MCSDEEKRYSYEEPTQHNDNKSQLNLDMLLPLIQSITGKKSPQNMMSILSKILFKDNPEMEKLFKLLPNKHNVEIKNDNTFPNTNTVKISNLKKIE